MPSEILQQPSRDQRGKLKTAKIPVKVIPMEGRPARKPSWIRVKAPIGNEVSHLKALLRE